MSSEIQLAVLDETITQVSDSDSFTTARTELPNTEQILVSEPVREWQDTFWMQAFMVHVVVYGIVLGVLGMDGFRLKYKYAYPHKNEDFKNNFAKDFLSFFVASAGVGGLIGVVMLLVLSFIAKSIMRVLLHIIAICLAVISASFYWNQEWFWGVIFLIATCSHLMYLISVTARLPFSLLVLEMSMKMIWSIKEVLGLACGFLITMLMWMLLWTFGVFGVLATRQGGHHRWIVLIELSVSLMWICEVMGNTLGLVVSRFVYQVLHHGGSMPYVLLIRGLCDALTYSFGSICYGSILISVIQTLRWAVNEIRSIIGTNGCLGFWFNIPFCILEIMILFFNKYAYNQIGAFGKNFHQSSKDAWQQFQSTSVEALLSYDSSEFVISMYIVLGGLFTSTCAAVWFWVTFSERVVVIGAISLLVGIIIIRLALTVVDSAKTSIYTCYAQDTSLIQSWDSAFATVMADKLQLQIAIRANRAS